MHEISICQSLVSVVLDELTQRAIGPGRLQRVRVVAGQLHQLVPDSLTFAYELLTRDTPAATSVRRTSVPRYPALMRSP